MNKKSILISMVTGILLGGLVTFFIFYIGKGVPPAEIADTMITCTRTVCTAQATSPSCSQLNVAASSCLNSANFAVCLAGLPALLNVGYADVVCIVAALEANPSKAILARKASKSKSRSIDKSIDQSIDQSIEKLGDLEVFDIQGNAAIWLRSQRVNVR